MRHVMRSWVSIGLLLFSGCNDGDGDDPAPAGLEASAEFRAISGVSMGAYGAMNLGTKRPELFGAIGSLGGPVDMKELLRHIIEDNLEVKPQTGTPRQVGDDFTFDHLPPYPPREVRISMMQDLVIALGNPFLHHPDPGSRFLASDSQPAALQVDDRYGTFSVPADPRGFQDGGDANEDGLRQDDELSPDEPADVILLAADTLSRIAGVSGSTVGGRELADLDGDGVFDVGDGLVVNFSEPFQDLDGDLVFEPDAGETFDDVGLDGVAGTGDFGEGNGGFDHDPDRARWLAEDPLSRLESRPASEIERQRIYMDVGTRDAFELEEHYLNVVDVLEAKGLDVAVEDGFPGSCTSVPDPDVPYLLVRYDGGHIGIPEADQITESLLSGDFCGPLVIWRRLVTLIGFMNESFPDGIFGPRGLRLEGSVTMESIRSPALETSAVPEVRRDVLLYRPPAFFNTGESFPIVYFLPGYGQEPGEFERVGDLLDLLISSGEVQNMYFVFLPAEGGRQGSFYVDHEVPHEQVPGIPACSGRYEASIIDDLMPAIEDTLLEGRVRS